MGRDGIIKVGAEIDKNVSVITNNTSEVLTHFDGVGIVQRPASCMVDNGYVVSDFSCAHHIIHTHVPGPNSVSLLRRGMNMPLVLSQS